MSVDLEELEQFHQKHFTGDDAHGLAHCRRVYENSKKIAKCYEVDGTSLALCAYFHDLVSFKKGHNSTSNRAKTITRKAVAEYFRENPQSSDVQEVVYDCIDSHSYSSRTIPRYIEGKVVQDADKIDALGYVGVARLFMVAGKVGSSMYEVNDPWAKCREPNDRRYALDHVVRKLRNLPREMNTAEGKALAQERLEKMEAFLGQMLDEIDGRFGQSTLF